MANRFCTQCGSETSSANAKFCRDCGSPLSSTRTNQVTVVQSNSDLNSLIPVDSQEGVKAYIEKLVDTHYTISEATHSNDLTWDIFGKHLAAYRARKHARGMTDSLMEARKEGMVNLVNQAADMELQRRSKEFQRQQEEIDNEFNQEQKAKTLDSELELYAAAMAKLSEIMSRPQFEGLNEDVRQMMVNQIFDVIMKKVFEDGITVLAEDEGFSDDSILNL